MAQAGLLVMAARTVSSYHRLLPPVFCPSICLLIYSSVPMFSSLYLSFYTYVYLSIWFNPPFIFISFFTCLSIILFTSLSHVYSTYRLGSSWRSEGERGVGRTFQFSTPWPQVAFRVPAGRLFLLLLIIMTLSYTHDFVVYVSAFPFPLTTVSPIILKQAVIRLK